MSGLRVIEPGVLSQFQDRGREGQHAMGLTQGGPLDVFAFEHANRLVRNAPHLTALEISMGGLELECNVETTLAVTGAAMPFTLNSQTKAAWRSHRVRRGDRVALGHTDKGCRAYLAVDGGFAVEPMFGSTATVVREGLGRALRKGDLLKCAATENAGDLALPMREVPGYPDEISLRVVAGYQHDLFPAAARETFFNSEYRVTLQCDRMGYRLSGPPVEYAIGSMLSEGICLGAVQVPADGQPIVLLNDRQTIGGYPKLGAVMSIDLARLAQCHPGACVRFSPITPEAARDALRTARERWDGLLLKTAG